MVNRTARRVIIGGKKNNARQNPSRAHPRKRLEQLGAFVNSQRHNGCGQQQRQDELGGVG
ncbi:MAG: hypothetical protein U5J82_06155 [Desulfobacterales bacterium]|nr:hypothetical protein [Desulfobacterales bacterium]